MIAIIDTELTVNNDLFDIVDYRVDGTECGVRCEGTPDFEYLQLMSEEDFDQLKLTPPWNHSLIQDGS